MKETGATAKKGKSEGTPTFYVLGAILYVLVDMVSTAARRVYSMFVGIIGTIRAGKSSGSPSTKKEKVGKHERSTSYERKNSYPDAKNGRYAVKARWYPFGKKVLWYWDVRLWLPTILLLFVFLLNVSYARGLIAAKPAETFAGENVEIIAEVVETEPEAPALDEEAVALARLADSVARGKSDEVKRIVMWVAINRSEDRSHGYGMPLLMEIARPKQWQEYNEDANYLESTYELAMSVVETWRNGGARPIYGDMLWFVFNADGSITVRNQFERSKNRSEATFGQ